MLDFFGVYGFGLSGAASSHSEHNGWYRDWYRNKRRNIMFGPCWLRRRYTVSMTLVHHFIGLEPSQSRSWTNFWPIFLPHSCEWVNVIYDFSQTPWKTRGIAEKHRPGRLLRPSRQTSSFKKHSISDLKNVVFASSVSHSSSSSTFGVLYVLKWHHSFVSNLHSFWTYRSCRCSVRVRSGCFFIHRTRTLPKINTKSTSGEATKHQASSPSLRLHTSWARMGRNHFKWCTLYTMKIPYIITSNSYTHESFVQ